MQEAGERGRRGTRPQTRPEAFHQILIKTILWVMPRARPCLETVSQLSGSYTTWQDEEIMPGHYIWGLSDCLGQLGLP